MTSRLVRQRGRIVRVRRLQHGLAASAAAAAAGQVQLLELNRERLGRMQSELQAGRGLTDGAGLARIGELALRIDTARQGLGQTIEGARAVAATREAERIAARREQESAEKLRQSAETAAARLAERRAPGAGRPRPGLCAEGDEG
ncbi:MAG: hypothetical protein ACK4K7_07080 [Allosphingosinicella sp.]|uniref:hypothetical protein n=1 Tax=Allosphingosinicella sp. TaxID=2823234 RepID=UPI00392B9B49